MTAAKKGKTGGKKTGTSAVKAAGGEPKAVSRRDKVTARGTKVTKAEKKKIRGAGKIVVRGAGEKEAEIPERLRELRRSLVNKRELIIKEAKEEIAKYISGENRQLVDTALDEGDLAVVDISEDVNLMRLASHRQSLLDIDEALRKIAEGTYGTCEECGEEIGEKRLSVLPAASLCRNCQEKKEKLEAIGKVQSGL